MFYISYFFSITNYLTKSSVKLDLLLLSTQRSTVEHRRKGVLGCSSFLSFCHKLPGPTATCESGVCSLPSMISVTGKRQGRKRNCSQVLSRSHGVVLTGFLAMACLPWFPIHPAPLGQGWHNSCLAGFLYAIVNQGNVPKTYLQAMQWTFSQLWLLLPR